MDTTKLLEQKLDGAIGEEKVNILNDLAYALYNSEPEKTEKYAVQALKLAKDIDYQRGIARSNNIVGISFHIRGNYPVAMKYYRNSLTIFDKIGDEQKVASAKHNIGSLNERLGNYKLALENYFAALKIWEKNNNKNHLSASYNNIGVIYEKLESNDLSLQYHLKSLEIKEELDDKYGMSVSFVNLGIIYSKKKQYDKALESLQKAIEIKTKIADVKGLATSYFNIGNFYYELDDYDKSIKFSQKALKSFNKVGDKYGIAAVKISLGKIYAEFKDYKNSYKFLNDSLELSLDIGAKSLEANAYLTLAELSEYRSNFKKALQYQKKYHETRSEIINEQKNAQITSIQNIYDLEVKQKEAELFKLKNKEFKKMISQLKKTEIELLNERNFAESIVDTAHAIILVLDTEGKIIKFNPYLEKLTGYTLNEMKGKDWFSNFLPPEEIQEIKTVFNKALNDDLNRSNISSIVTKNGTKRAIEWFDKILTNSKNENIGLLGVGHDVTEILNSEKNLKNSKALIKKIISILRHDIINDLVVIKSALNIFRNNSNEEMLNEIDKRVKNSLDIIQRQRNQESFIDAYSHLTEFCVENVVSEVSKNYNNIEVNVTGSGNIYANNAIYAIFENLFDNSIKHGKTKKIDINITTKDDKCIIRFADFGIGMTDETKSSVFGENLKNDETQIRGFGLNFVQYTIQAYGGTIWLEDNDPQGVLTIINLQSGIKRELKSK